jgi:predicted nuclease of restriction endonuclease-like RecB superfamily
MLTGNLVRVKVSKERVTPRYLDRGHPYWLEVAESLLLVFREAVSRTRGEIEAEIDSLYGEGGTETLAHRGLAKVLEDRGEFEVVANRPPEEIRGLVFKAAADHRRRLRAEDRRTRFCREEVLETVARQAGLTIEQIDATLFADLKDENRMLRFHDLSARALIDRYNVALAQAVLLRSTQVRVEVRGETPAMYRQFFRRLKFHRLLYRVEKIEEAGYRIALDGPLSLFSSTTKYGLQMALFLPAVLQCRAFRLDAEVRWGPKREPRHFLLETRDGLVAPAPPQAQYVPAEIKVFIERFRQIAPDWDVSEHGEIIELGREGVWVPDYRFVHRPSGHDVLLDVLGFWRRSSLERLLKLLPKFNPQRAILAISERMKVDEETVSELPGAVLRFKEIPSAPELLALLERSIGQPGQDRAR